MSELYLAVTQAMEALCMPCDRWNGEQTRAVNNAVEALRSAIAVMHPFVNRGGERWAALNSSMETLRAAKLCHINSMSNRHEMFRLLNEAIEDLSSVIQLIPGPEVSNAMYQAAQQGLEALSLPCERWTVVQRRIVKQAVLSLKNAMTKQASLVQVECESLSRLRRAKNNLHGAKLCSINSMSSYREMLRLIDDAIVELDQLIRAQAGQQYVGAAASDAAASMSTKEAFV